MDVIKLKKAVNILKLQNIALPTLVNFKLLKERNKKLRRWWVKPHLFPEIRDAVGAYAMVCQYFKLNDHEEFERQFKLTAGNFDSLYHLVGNKLKKIHSLLRAPIPPYIRLALTLHYLAHGGSVKIKSLYYRVGKSTYYTIIPKTCKAISDVLIPMYMKLPEKEDWIHIAQDFERKWNFPNCNGALD